MDYYIYKDDQNIGPLSESEVSNGLREGRFLPSDLGCRVGESEWKDLGILFPTYGIEQIAPRTPIVYEPPPVRQQLPSIVQPRPMYESSPAVVHQPQVIYQSPPNSYGGNADIGKMMMYESNKKSTGIAYLLWFFFGLLGAHRFYIGETGTGVAILLITICSIMLKFVLIGFVTIFISIIWVFIDLFLIPSLVQKHNNQLAARLNIYS